MKTSVTEVGNAEESTCKRRVRVFLDSGSSRSYITTRLAKLLGLRIELRQSLVVDRFGGQDEDPLTIEIWTAKIDVWSRNGDKARIWLAVSDKAITQISRKAVPAEVMASLPDGVHLADSPLEHNETVAVDLLIGNHYYDDFVMQGKILLRADSRPLSQNSGGSSPEGSPIQRNRSKRFRAAK